MFKHTQAIRRQTANELFECVSPFCGVDTYRFKDKVAFNFQTDLKSSKIVLNRNTGNKLAAYKYVW